MAFLQTLYSGSSGNSTLLHFEEGSLLVDMGCSCRRTIKSLYDMGVSVSDLKGILITHEHIDHVAGLKVFLKGYDIPVYGLPECLDFLRERGLVPDMAQLIAIEPDRTITLAGADIHPFRTQHDSLGCCGFRFESGRATAAVATDIGKVTESVFSCLEGCGVVALESNYDDGTLMAGPYPFLLKQRIRSDYGHLSNNDCSANGIRLVEKGTKRFALMHLSKENNTPDLAEMTFRGFLDNYGIEDVSVKAAPRSEPGERYVL